MIQELEGFIEANKGKSIVVVQGLGFVGGVMSLVVANSSISDYAVVVVDLPTTLGLERISKYNSGEFPIISADPKVTEFYNSAFAKRSIFATHLHDAYSYADVIIVDVNLDVEKGSSEQDLLTGYDVDLSNFKQAILTIGQNCSETVLVLIETTVPPGTTEKIVMPLLKKTLIERGKDADRLKIAHSYERVMPGPNYVDSIKNFYRVYSGINAESEKAAELFLRTIISTETYPLTKLGNTTATEMAKVLENSYRAMNIAFMVEWSRFAELSGVNLYEVVSAIRMRPTHNNMMLPGIGVGGYCLTKDPLLADWASNNLFEAKTGLGQSFASVLINDLMPSYAYEFWKRSFQDIKPKAHILLLGVSYRSEVDDTRYSPVEPFYRRLKKELYSVKIHDPYVKFWNETEIKVDFNSDNWKEIDFSEFDSIVFSTGHREYANSSKLIDQLMLYHDLRIMDTIGVLSNEEISLLSRNHKVRVLGRGDLK
jgi:UDP-N-acetyl-D-glucosamine dehydrogenase